jgi:serine/threonine protein kinase
LAPEVLFNKSCEHDAKMDVWSFGMILFCLLTGKKPKSFYTVYRDWYRKSSRSGQNPCGYDVEASQLPFTPPSRTNFVYDPFSYDFDNPFESGSIQDPDLGKEVMKQLKGLSESADLDTPGDF